MVTSLSISVLHDFHLFDVAATSAVTITPEDGEEGKSEDEVNDETESSEAQNPGTEKRYNQPLTQERQIPTIRIMTAITK